MVNINDDFTSLGDVTVNNMQYGVYTSSDDISFYLDGDDTTLKSNFPDNWGVSSDETHSDKTEKIQLDKSAAESFIGAFVATNPDVVLTDLRIVYFHDTDENKLYYLTYNGNLIDNHGDESGAGRYIVAVRRTIMQSEIDQAVTHWTDESGSYVNRNLPLNKYGPIELWDTSLITDMSNLFNGKDQFDDDISDWNTSNVTTMNNMFENASSFNRDIRNWNVDKASLENMFLNATDMYNNFSEEPGYDDTPDKSFFTSIIVVKRGHMYPADDYEQTLIYNTTTKFFFNNIYYDQFHLELLDEQGTNEYGTFDKYRMFLFANNQRKYLKFEGLEDPAFVEETKENASLFAFVSPQGIISNYSDSNESRYDSIRNNNGLLIQCLDEIFHKNGDENDKIYFALNTVNVDENTLVSKQHLEQTSHTNEIHYFNINEYVSLFNMITITVSLTRKYY